MSGVLWTFASKRMSEKTTPHSGAGAEADAAEGNRQPSRFTGVWAQKDDVMGQPAKGVAQNGQGGGQGNGQGGATPHDEAAREAAQKEKERGMVPAFPAFPAIPELPFDQEAVVEEARKRAEAVVAFWKVGASKAPRVAAAHRSARHRHTPLYRVPSPHRHPRVA